MAIFNKLGDIAGGAFESFAGDALKSMTGGFDISKIGSAVSGALKGDFSGVIELGLTAVATKYLGPHLGPKAAEFAMGLTKGDGLNTEAVAGALEESGVLPGSDSFGLAMDALGQVADGGMSRTDATNLIAGLGVVDPNLLAFIERVGSGEIDVASLVLGGGFTGGFGGPGAGDLLVRS